MPSLIAKISIGLAVSFICYVSVAVAIQQDTMNGIQEGSIDLDIPVIEKQLERVVSIVIKLIISHKLL